VVVVALAGQVVVAFDDFGRRRLKTLRLHSTHSMQDNAHTVPALKLALQTQLITESPGRQTEEWQAHAITLRASPTPRSFHFPLLVLMLIDASEAEERSNDIRGCFGPWAGEPEM